MSLRGDGFPCGRHALPPISRREMLTRCAGGFGAVALAALRAEAGFGGEAETRRDPLAPRAGHHPARARNVIFLYMDGGPSQVDTFDPKPRLQAEHGQPIRMPAPPTQFIPHNAVPRVMASPWQFHRHGQSGTPVSELFPHLAACVDELCIVRSM